MAKLIFIVPENRYRYRLCFINEESPTQRTQLCKMYYSAFLEQHVGRVASDSGRCTTSIAYCYNFYLQFKYTLASII